MSELWSKPMRKWAKDAQYHGIQIGLYNSRARPPKFWDGGGTPAPQVSTANVLLLQSGGPLFLTDGASMLILQ